MKAKKPQAAVVKTAVSDRIRTTLGSVMVLAAVLGAPLIHAQAQVVDSSNRLMTTPPGATGSAPNAQAAVPSPHASTPQVFAAAPAQTQAQAQAQSAPGSPQEQLFYTVQALQEELATLRGLVEEQDHELKRLKQQRLDDYLNLDRRLAELSGKPAMGAGAAGAGDRARDNSSATNSRTQPAAAEQSADEMQSYRAAIDLVLRQKNYDQAMVAFNQYLTDYPQGTYAANSEYWLGEISLLQGNLEKSRSWFERLLSDYPQHDKAADAQYKLGTVYHKLGDVQKAKSLLNEVVANNPNTNAARLASNYLSGI